MGKLAVVLMTFADEYEHLFESVLEPVLKKCGYDVFKANDSPKAGDIADEVIDKILNAEIVIAEVSVHNPNVYYELGVSHTIGSKTILIATDPGKLPFYLRPQRVLVYTTDKQGRRQLRNDLENWIRTAELSRDLPSNPVQRAAGEFPKLLQRFKEEMSYLLEERRRMTVFDRFTSGAHQNYGLNHSVITGAAVAILQREAQVGITTVAAVLGTSAVGKSLFSEQVASEICARAPSTKVSLLGTDCYMLSRAEKRLKGITGFDPASHRLGELYRDVAALVGGKSITVSPYDHATGDRGDQIVIQPCDILIVEGVHAFYHRLIPFAQGLRFFLYADAGTAKELKFLVDFLERGYDIKGAFAHGDREYDDYERHTLPMLKLADFIVEVTDYWEYKGPFPEGSWDGAK